MTDHLTSAYNNLMMAAGAMRDASGVVALLNALGQAQVYVLAASSTAYGGHLGKIEAIRNDVLALQGRMAEVEGGLQASMTEIENKWPG